MKRSLVAAVLLFVAFTWWMWSAERRAHDRELFAEGSSTDDLRFTAAGLRGQTFVIAESDPLTCTVYLDKLAYDSAVSLKIRRVGFTKASCGGETRDVR